MNWARPAAAFGFFGSLYPIYVRGLVYLDTNRGTDAAAEFQKILDHRGIVISDPVGVLAHWQLGRALVLSGDNVKARIAYQDFLPLERRRSRHPHPQASQDRVCNAAVISPLKNWQHRGRVSQNRISLRGLVCCPFLPLR